MTKAKNVGVFVNVTNQFYATMTAYGRAKIAYEAYLQKALGKDALYRAFAYGVAAGPEVNRFVKALRGFGYEPRYFPVKPSAGKTNVQETDLNGWIYCDVVRLLDRLDVVVLGSNDPDLIPLILYIKERGVKCVLMACGIPPELRDVADEAIEITEDLLEQRVKA